MYTGIGTQKKEKKLGKRKQVWYSDKFGSDENLSRKGEAAVALPRMLLFAVNADA